jgi:hypothetical protein
MSCESGGMGMRELLIGAIVVGGAAGYVWSAAPGMFAEAKVPAPPKPSIALYEVPPTTADAEADSAWAAGESAPVASTDSSAAQAEDSTEQSAD